MNSETVRVRVFRTGAIAAAAAVLGLSGCTVLAPVEEQTRFYSLAPASGAGHLGAVASPDAPAIGVRVTSVADHLRKPSIAVRVGEHELIFDPEQRWAEQLKDAVEYAVAADVQRAAGPRLNVFVAPALRSNAADVLIEIDLLACEGRRAAESSALVVADWRIFKGREPRPAASGRFRVEKPGWNGTDFSQLAALLDAALDDLAQAAGGPAVKIAAE